MKKLQINSVFKGFDLKLKIKSNLQIWAINQKLQPVYTSKVLPLMAEPTEESFRDSLVSEANNYKVKDSSAANKISDMEMSKILSHISADRECSKGEAFAALALLAQMGATSARVQNNVNVIIDQTYYKVDLIKQAIHKNSNGKSFRRVAKSFATEIKVVAQNNACVGNLLNKIKVNYPDFTIEKDEEFWVSDFQSENHDCPQRIRDIINRYYNDFIRK